MALLYHWPAAQQLRLGWLDFNSPNVSRCVERADLIGQFADAEALLTAVRHLDAGLEHQVHGMQLWSAVTVGPPKPRMVDHELAELLRSEFDYSSAWLNRYHL